MTDFKNNEVVMLGAESAVQVEDASTMPCFKGNRQQNFPLKPIGGNQLWSILVAGFYYALQMSTLRKNERIDKCFRNRGRKRAGHDQE